MKSAENYRSYLGRLLWLLFVLLSTSALAKPGEMKMGADTENTFPVLQTRTATYTNVTVTKKTKEWIFILHSAGVCNVKVSDLPEDALISLGYEKPPDPKAEAAAKSSSTNQVLAQLTHIKLDEVKQFANGWRHDSKAQMAQVQAFATANPTAISIALGIVGGVYIFVSVCFWCICRKTHIAPGPLVWVPFLQLIPLLRAANMPRVWFFAYFLPIINIIPIIVLAIKIVKSRGKSPWVAFLLLLPPTSLFAFLYLALSSSAPVEIESNEIIALETA